MNNSRRQSSYFFKRLVLATIGIALVVSLFGSTTTPNAHADTGDPPVKSAQVNGKDWDSGTEKNPVPVVAGDEINYKISANLQDLAKSNKYDILFDVDWSSTMDDGMMTSTLSALQYTKNLCDDMSQYILGNYPGSRVAVMGLASEDGYNNRNDPAYTYLFVDTPFVDNISD
ncbi:MAG: hypothetical protein FWF45_08130, partial [Coriobacteriia bacterium]|nr:hypothetical protein [Coriobacteriia bacterium]